MVQSGEVASPDRATTYLSVAAITVALLSACVSAFVWSARGSAASSVVSAHKFVLLGPDGRPIASFANASDGSVALAFTDANRSGPRAWFGIGPDGTPRLLLKGTDGQTRAALEVAASGSTNLLLSGAPNIIMRDSTGRLAATLGFVESGDAWGLDFYDPEGTPKTTIGMLNDGSSFLLGHDRSGRLVWHVP